MNDSGAGASSMPEVGGAKDPAPVVSAVPSSGHASTDDGAVFLQWTRRDRWFLAVLALVILALLAVQFLRLSGWGLRPLLFERPESRRYEFQIDVNSAGWVEWMQLEGIGETTARKIVADREEQGPFTSVDDVARVKGIGPATLEKMRPWLRCEGEKSEAR